MIWKPHVTVAAIIEQDQKYLMVEEKVDGKMVFNQPAGHLEPDESVIDAVIRETREETACIFKPLALIGLYRWPMPDQQRTYIRYSFSGEITEQLENASLDPDIERTVWLSYEEIIMQKDKLRSPLVLHCIDDYRSGLTYPLDLLKDISN